MGFCLCVDIYDNEEFVYIFSELIGTFIFCGFMQRLYNRLLPFK